MVEIGDRAVGDSREYVVTERAIAVGVYASSPYLLQIRIVVGTVAAGSYRHREGAATACAGDDDLVGRSGHRLIVEPQIPYGRLRVHDGCRSVAGKCAVGSGQPATARTSSHDDVAGLQGRADSVLVCIADKLATRRHDIPHRTVHPPSVVYPQDDGRARIVGRSVGDVDIHLLP